MDAESTIQFLLEQQARHETRQQEFEADLAKVNAMLLQTNATMLEVAAAQARSNEILATLAERQIKTEDSVSELASHVQTLMSVVERHIANHSHQ